MWRWLYPPLLVALICALVSCTTSGDGPARGGGAGSAPVAGGTAIPIAAVAPTATVTSTPLPPTATPTIVVVPTPTATRAPTRTPTVAPEVVPIAPPASCPVTPPPDPPFVPPDPPTLYAGSFWHGTAALWTDVRKDGTWRRLPYNDGAFTQKVFWWRQGYNAWSEPEPKLIVTGRRLDAPAPPLVASRATNAMASDIGHAMLVGVDLPTPGCWEITGRYAGTTVTFVVWVVP